MIRFLIFLVGLAAVVVGALSHFEVATLPIEIHSRMVTVGTAEFKLDFVLMVVGIPLLLLGLPKRKARRR